MFAFGLTGDANALLPLLLACAVSLGLSVLMMRRSIMTERIARRRRHVHREYGVDPQERVRVGEVMTRDVRTIPAQAALRAVTEEWFGPAQEHRAFPVVEPGGACVGLLDRERLWRADAGARSAGDLFEVDDAVFALPGETCRVAAQRLATHGLERLPVVADLRSRRLVGIVVAAISSSRSRPNSTKRCTASAYSAGCGAVEREDWQGGLSALSRV